MRIFNCTRLSFTVGISNLGANAINIWFEELNISRNESFEDTFRAMECYLDVWSTEQMIIKPIQAQIILKSLLLML